MSGNITAVQTGSGWDVDQTGNANLQGDLQPDGSINLDAKGSAAVAAALPIALPAGVSNFKRTNTMNWQKVRAKVKAGTARARLGFIGDSTKVGEGSGGSNGANAQVKGPVNQLAKFLSARGLNAVNSSFFGANGAARWGQTLPVQDPRIAMGANWSITWNYQRVIPGGEYIAYTTGAANNLSFTPSEAFDTIDIYYYAVAGNGSFTSNIDGGSSLGTINSGAATGVQKQTYTFTRVSGGTHVINIVPSNNGNLAILGIDAYDSTVPAVSLLNFAARGACIKNFADPASNVLPSFTLPDAFNLYGVDLWIVDLTVNDSNKLNDYSLVGPYQTYLDAFVTKLLSVGTADVILAVGPPSNTTNATNGTLASYVAAVYAVATKYNLPVLDLFARYGSYAATSWAYYDIYHLKAEGYADEVELYGAALLAAP